MRHVLRQWGLLGLLLCIVGCQQTAPAPANWAEVQTALAQRMQSRDADSGFLSMQVSYLVFSGGDVAESTLVKFMDSTGKAYCFQVEKLAIREKEQCTPTYLAIPSTSSERQLSFQAFTALRVTPAQAIAITLAEGKDFMQHYHLSPDVVGSLYPSRMRAPNQPYDISAYVWRLKIVDVQHEFQVEIDPVTGQVLKTEEEHAQQ